MSVLIHDSSPTRIVMATSPCYGISVLMAPLQNVSNLFEQGQVVPPQANGQVVSESVTVVCCRYFSVDILKERKDECYKPCEKQGGYHIGPHISPIGGPTPDGHAVFGMRIIP